MCKCQFKSGKQLENDQYGVRKCKEKSYQESKYNGDDQESDKSLEQMRKE